MSLTQALECIADGELVTLQGDLDATGLRQSGCIDKEAIRDIHTGGDPIEICQDVSLIEVRPPGVPQCAGLGRRIEISQCVLAERAAYVDAVAWTRSISCQWAKACEGATGGAAGRRVGVHCT